MPVKSRLAPTWAFEALFQRHIAVHTMRLKTNFASLLFAKAATFWPTAGSFWKCLERKHGICFFVYHDELPVAWRWTRLSESAYACASSKVGRKKIRDSL